MGWLDVDGNWTWLSEIFEMISDGIEDISECHLHISETLCSSDLISSAEESLNVTAVPTSKRNVCFIQGVANSFYGMGGFAAEQPFSEKSYVSSFPSCIMLVVTI